MLTRASSPYTGEPRLLLSLLLVEGGGGEAVGGSENYSIRDEVTPYRSTGTYRAAGISQAKPISLCRKANNSPHLFKKSILHSPLLVL